MYITKVDSVLVITLKCRLAPVFGLLVGVETSLPLLQGPLLLGVIVLVRILSVDRIDLFEMIKCFTVWNDACSVIVTVVGIGYFDPSLNPRQGCLHFT